MMRKVLMIGRRPVSRKFGNVQFSEMLRACIADAGMNQSSLSRELGITQAAVCQYCNSARLPSKKILLRMRSVFEFDDKDWTRFMHLASSPSARVLEGDE